MMTVESLKKQYATEVLLPHLMGYIGELRYSKVFAVRAKALDGYHLYFKYFEETLEKESVKLHVSKLTGHVYVQLIDFE